MSRKRRRGGWTKKGIESVLETMKAGAKCSCGFCTIASRAGSAALENQKGELLAFGFFELTPAQ